MIQFPPRTWRFPVALLMAAGMLASAAAHAQQAPQQAPQQVTGAAKDFRGALRGTVTLEGAPVAGLQVVLYVMRNGADETRSFAASDTSGAFRFERVKTDPAFSYVVSAEYDGVVYHTAPLVFAAGEQEKEVSLSVARTTTSDAQISVPQEHLILEPHPGKIRVTTVMVVRNSGARAYVGFEQVGLGKREVVKLHLPIGYKDFQFIQGGATANVELVDWGGSYTRPLPPGSATLAFQYDLPVTGGKLVFSRNVGYAIKRFDILISVPKIKEPNNPNNEISNPEFRASSGMLTDQGVFNLRGRSMRRFSGQDVRKGSSVSVTLSGLAPAGFWSAHSNIAYLVIVIIILAGLLVPLASAKKRKQVRQAGGLQRESRQQAKAQSAPQSGPADNGGETAAKSVAKQRSKPASKTAVMASRKEDLFETLVSLEEKHEAGEIVENDYQTRREELRGELKDLLHAMPRQT